MKMKRTIMKLMTIVMVAILGMGTTISLAVQDHTGENELPLRLSLFRYSNGVYTNGYAYSSRNNKPIYQIMDGNNKKNYYCLNAKVGEGWATSSTTDLTVPANAIRYYNRSYDLDSQSDIKALKEDSSIAEAYRNIGNSSYLRQILWVLDNIYVAGDNADENLSQKRALLAKAGIVYGDIVKNDEVIGQGYKYIAQEGYDYTEKLRENEQVELYYPLEGYVYNDSEGNYQMIELPDELVEVAGQAVLWYFTNYLDDNSDKDETFNIQDKWIDLVCSNGIEETNSSNWKALSGQTFNVPTNIDDYEVPVGACQQEMTAVLCNYLIDAANNYATSENSNISGSPLKITPSTTNIETKTINGTKYYVIGPMKIETQREAKYDLSNTITVNGSTNTEAYISSREGVKITNKTLSDCVGEDFFITVPASKITGDNIKIDFEGTYKTNGKTLWISTTSTEQPVAEVTPKTVPIELTVNATINKVFDLALRKSITKLTDSKGNAKLITNEEGKLATRNISYIASNIAENGTAIYNHRKDPVVVKKGDIVTYSITVYNEGDMAGYAETIVDKLPEGLKIKGPLTGTYTSGNIRYKYEYDEITNTITFTNVSKNSLEAYQGGETLSSETIEVECEVTGEPTTTTNSYLTNIAYIAKEYNTEKNEEVEVDRDSSTKNNPSSNQTTTGDKYTGYHGGNNNNGDNNKNVYNDGTNNDDYFPGKEDDDDFEVIVIQPADFDLALQKYISSVYSKGTTKPGRQEPTINTEKLASGEEKTATYIQDKEPIRVKHGDYVTYTFTVYNEGEVDGYVNKITDNIPKGLQFVYPKVPADGKTLIAVNSQGEIEDKEGIEVDEATYNLVSTNNSCWSIDSTDGNLKTDNYNGESTISITCDVKSYLGGTNQLLKAYDSSKDNNNNGAGLDRTSVTVLLRVEAQDGKGITIRNEAAITEAEDTAGNKQDAGNLIDRDSQIDQWPGKDGDKKYQDDEDYDNIILGKVDLALTKFIAAVSEDIKIEDGEYLTKDTTSKDAGSASNPYTRATKVDTTELKNNPECHDATYTRVKDPLTVPEQSYVLYNIRVYNEGEVDVYAGKVTDHLPNYLDYVDGDFNKSFGWDVSSDGKTVTTEYLSYANGTDKMLKAFDKEKDQGAGEGLSHQDLQILCRVNSKTPDETKLVNSAQISKYEDEDGNDLPEDTDSKPGNLEEKNKENREEDDDDWEVVLVKNKKVDLALTKFITAVSNDTEINDGEYLTKDGKVGSKENPYTRATKVDTKELRDNPECHDAKYEMVKDPLTVPAKSYVLYNIRVYNEGEVDVYAGEVTDHLPDYLDYVDCDFNKEYGWNVSSDGKTISTKHLAFNENDKEEKNLLKAFDKKTDDGEGSKLDYRDLQILCRVNDTAPTNTHIVNVAEITKYEDKEGKDIPKDEDSTPDNVDEKNEDDDDYEVVEIKTFDLSLLKYVTTVYVTEDGKTTTTHTGNVGDANDIMPKVEIHRKKVNSTIVKFGYTIKITNEGDIAGYAKEITDYVPQGLKFYSEDNQGWTDEGNNVISTRLLENTLLRPGESAEVTVILRWINGSNNLGMKTNTAEISEDYNDEGVPDKDSTPDNQKPGEDDIDNADVILSISTGLAFNIIKYMGITCVILVVLGTGIVLIKKYVL